MSVSILTPVSVPIAPPASAFWTAVDAVVLSVPGRSPLMACLRKLREHQDEPAACRLLEPLPDGTYRVTFTLAQLRRVLAYASQFRFGAPY